MNPFMAGTKRRQNGRMPEDDNAADTTLTGERGIRQRRRAVAAAVLAVLMIANGALGWMWAQQREADIAQRDAQASAQAFTETLINIDPADIDAGVQRTLELSTGEFRDVYATSSQELRRALVEHQATAHGTILESAATVLSDDSVEVLLFVDQAVSNATLSEPRLDRSRIRLTMERVDGRWLAGKVEMP